MARRNGKGCRRGEGDVAAGCGGNEVLPGRIDTDRVRELDEGRAQRSGMELDAVQQAARNEIPAGRYGQPEEFGATVAFLASQQASYITGSMIRVDGGATRGH
ncbi:SDR family oxidoreductase [Radicibacter daui]|uniref:SDR family oxidoreductase n=1 Tax=Radicibacter daui TaxID=3064829 RepID=UPI004046CEFA